VIRPRLPKLTLLAQKIKPISGSTRACRCGSFASLGFRPAGTAQRSDYGAQRGARWAAAARTPKGVWPWWRPAREL